jgi:predicted RNA-binding Zn ribbon-like protein
MASVVVDGVRMPVLVSGHPALDFCNTLVGWGEPDPVEALVSYEALVRFTAYLGLLGTAQVGQLLAAADVSRPAASQVLRRARELRGATYDIVTSAAGPRQWSVVRRAVGSAAAAGVLEEGEDSLGRWAYDVRSAGLATPLHLLAWQVSDLLTAEPPARVGRCPGRQCGWVFINRGNRRWCIMATCGNRAKARRHAAAARRAPG